MARQVMNAEEIRRALTRISHEIIEKELLRTFAIYFGTKMPKGFKSANKIEKTKIE